VLRYNSPFDILGTMLSPGTAGPGGAGPSGNSGANGSSTTVLSDPANPTVVAAPAAPLATYALLVTNLNTPAVPVTPSVADLAPAPYTFEILGQAQSGSAGVAGGQLNYTPDPGFSGMDWFPFRASRAGGAVDGFAVVVVNSPCYANCDASTTAPILNVEDFACFINAFAAAQSLPPAQQVTNYANCDASTVMPVLNVEDFACFINRFAAGCP
jgi:hypothetical protein